MEHNFIGSIIVCGVLETPSSPPNMSPVLTKSYCSYLTQWVRDSWTQFGLDSVSLATYDYLLSYPDPANPNKVYLYDQDMVKQFESKHKEDVLRPEDAHENFIHAFNAYAPAGDVTGELVYVNYGRLVLNFNIIILVCILQS